jgi:hypothetical protein
MSEEQFSIKYSINKKTAWYLITIDDPAFLPLKSIYGVISLIKTIINFRFAILNDINGGFVAELIDLEGEIMTIENLFHLLSGSGQLDWGDFFLFCEKPEDWNNPKDYYYPTLIKQSDTTVRAVDDQYIYIYTPCVKIRDLIKANYKIESIKEDALEKLDFPY